MNGISCAGPLSGGTGVNYHEAKTLISDFCAGTASSIVGPFKNQTGTFKTASGNSNILLNVSYTTTRQTYDTSCSLETAAELIVNEATCEHAFYRLLDECDTSPSGYLGKYGGVATSGCGVYTLVTQPEEIIACGDNPYPRSVDMPLPIMRQGIAEYCSTPLELAPDYIFSDTFLVDIPKGQSRNNYIKGDIVVKAVTEFSGQGQTDCGYSKPFSTDGDECKRKLTAIMDQCGGTGGALSESGKYGCVLWTIWGQHATGHQRRIPSDH